MQSSMISAWEGKQEAFVNSICKSAWFNLFNISRSRRSLTTDAAKILIQAYVMSKIDYCNSLLYGIPDKLLNRIQRIQNYAARVILRLHKFSHITPALATLHWLPVKRRIDFKIALLVYKALNGQAPAYILSRGSELFCTWTSVWANVVKDVCPLRG